MAANKPLSLTVEQSEFCKGIWRAHHERGLMEAFQQASAKWPIDHGVFLGEMSFIITYEGQDLNDKIWPAKAWAVPMPGDAEVEWPEGTPTKTPVVP